MAKSTQNCHFLSYDVIRFNEGFVQVVASTFELDSASAHSSRFCGHNNISFAHTSTTSSNDFCAGLPFRSEKTVHAAYYQSWKIFYINKHKTGYCFW